MKSKIIILAICITVFIAVAVFGGDVKKKDESSSPTALIKPISENLNNVTKADIKKSSPKDEALEFLKKLEAKNKDVKTIEGKFSQVKNQKIFLEEIKSEGVFYFKKPGKFRCDYLAPNEMINYLIDNVAYMYVPENKQVDKYTFNSEGSQIKQLNQMLLGFGVSVNDIDKVFNYEIDSSLTDKKDERALVLVPKEKDKGVGISRVHLWFDSATLTPKKILSFEESGDETTITIKDIKVNKGIPDDKFIPKFPKDVDIIEQN